MMLWSEEGNGKGRQECQERELKRHLVISKRIYRRIRDENFSVNSKGKEENMKEC
jgi:hypothetical protein